MLKIIEDRQPWAEAVGRIHGQSVRCAFDYMDAAATLEVGGVPQLAVYENGDGVVVHPYIRRPVPFRRGVYDLVSPHEFGGFWFSVCDKGRKDRLMAAFYEAFKSSCREFMICCEFIRFSPFDPYRSGNVYEEQAVGMHAFARLSDLKNGDLLFDTFDASLRWALRKAERLGLTVASCDVDTFLPVFYKNLKRIGAKEFFYFPKVFFKKISAHIMFFQAKIDDEIYAAHAYLKDHRTLFAFLCHGVWEKRYARPNDYLYYHMMRFALGEGMEMFHFGGGDEELYKYKTKFTKQTLPAYIGTTIFNLKLYEQLVEEIKLESPVADETDYFPKYRVVSS